MRKKPRKDGDDLRPEYDFDYSKGRPNPFARLFKKKCLAVVLDPDVAEVFGSSKKVNDALRRLIKRKV